MSLKDRKLYVGYTTNLDERIKRHRAGKVPATSHRIPIELIYYESYLTSKEKAEDFERYQKTPSGHAFSRKRLI